jgi:protein TonB
MFVLSLVVHVVGFGVTVGLPRILPRSQPGTPVYVVDLVSLPAQAKAKGRPAGGRQPKKKPAPVAKKKEAAIKLPDRPRKDPPPEKPKPPPEPTPEPKKVPEPTPPMEESSPVPEPLTQEAPPAKDEDSSEDGSDQAAASASDGPAMPGGATLGVPGGVGGPMADAYTFYFSLLRRRIENSWQKPIYPPTFSDRRTLLVTVLLGLSSSGRVTSLNLTTPSGYDALDRSILRAVRDAEPFPPFPPQIGRSSLTIPIEFEFKPD